MQRERRFLKLREACAEAGIEEAQALRYIRHRWVVVERSDRPDVELDEEDVARIHLILELQRDFGVNDEGVDIILHLIDQLNAFRAAVRGRRAG